MEPFIVLAALGVIAAVYFLRKSEKKSGFGGSKEDGRDQKLK